MNSYVYRDSITGEFVSEEYADSHPDTTQKHRVGRSPTMAPGEFWITRNGRRAKILHRFAPQSGYVESRQIVALLNPGDIRNEVLLFANNYGQTVGGQENDHDLIRPWSDAT